MIPVDEIPSESLEARLGGDGAWRTDIALEMWIDTTRCPVEIRLAGVLDAATGANLVHVVQDCINEGLRQFALDTADLCIDVSGWRVVEQVSARVCRAGGNLQMGPAAR